MVKKKFPSETVIKSKITFDSSMQTVCSKQETELSRTSVQEEQLQDLSFIIETTEKKEIDPELQKIYEKYAGKRGALLAILRDIQISYGYLPQAKLEALASVTKLSLADIYGMASFYKYFSFKPKGKHHISVCTGTACHVGGSPKIVEEFERILGIKVGNTTADKEFTLETVNCVGACALGPIVIIDGHYFSHLKIPKVKKILTQAQEGLDKVDQEDGLRIFPIVVRCPRCNHKLMDVKKSINGYPTIKVTGSFQNQYGSIRLSCLWGSYNVISDLEIPEDTVVHFFCPHCHSELTSPSVCVECEAPLINMIVEGGAIVQVCSRKGCKTHMLDLSGVNL